MNYFSELLSKDIFGRTYGMYLWAFLILLASMIISRLIVYVLERKLKVWLGRYEIPIDLVARSLSKPLGFLAVIAGFYFASLVMTVPDQFSLQWANIIKSLVVASVALFFYRFTDFIQEILFRLTAKTENKIDDMLVPIIRKTLRIFIVMVATVQILEINTFDTKTLLTGIGLGGLALSLAAKDTIANFFGSFTIFTDKPFIIGDRILIDDKDGVVEEVGMRSTRIRTLTGHLVTIPNNMVANTPIENISARPNIKRITNLGITYDTPPEKVELAVQLIKDILAETENLEPDYYVFFNEYADFYLNIFILFWVTPADYWLFQQVNEQINLKIMRAFAEHNIEFAFPTQTLYLNNLEGSLSN